MSKEVRRKETSGDPAKIGDINGGYHDHAMGDADPGFSVSFCVCTADGTMIPSDELEGVEPYAWADLPKAVQTAWKAAFTATRTFIEGDVFPKA